MNTPRPGLTQQDRLCGALLGCAVGDALGLPAEGLSARRIARRWRGPLQHRFLFRRGMWSDDTERTFMVAQALLAAPADAAAFRRNLARRLRWIPGEWITGLLEWPRTVASLRTMAERLAQTAAGHRPGPLRISVPGILVRNVLFLIVVLAHGFRRLLPPW